MSRRSSTVPEGIVHGDCARELRKVPSRSVDLVCTDPPYLIGAKGCGLAGNRQYLRDITARHLDRGFDAALLDEFLRVLKRPNLIVFCSRLQLRDYLNWAHQHRLKWALISWHKTNPTPLTNNNYLPDTEYILHFWRDRKLGGCYRTKRRYYVQPAERTSYGHPTVKPLNIVMHLIENATDVGDLVLDPFAGSGTTAVAAKILRRRFLGFEIDRQFVSLAHRRLALEGPDGPSRPGE